jgi:predicted esterase
MKRLQELSEERWEFRALAVMDGAIRSPENPKQVILLLHGLGERGRRIYRKLGPYLPDDALILAPNGPFPLNHEGDNRMGYTWYFYSRAEQRYVLNQDMARSWIKELLGLKNPGKLPLTIIGFSQGGYLAPLVGHDAAETKLVIGLGCEFRQSLVTHMPAFRLEGIHGLNDTVISLEGSRSEAQALKDKGFPVDWRSVEGGHEITPEMGQLVKGLLHGN